MNDVGEHQRGVVITTNDYYAFSQEYFDIIEKNIKTNPNLEVVNYPSLKGGACEDTANSSSKIHPHPGSIVD